MVKRMILALIIVVFTAASAACNFGSKVPPYGKQPDTAEHKTNVEGDINEAKNEPSLNIDDQEQPVSEVKKTVKLYFSNSEADAIVAETRDIYIMQNELLEAAVIRELAKGPETEGLYGVIPEGTRLLSAETKDGICRLNLSREFVDNSNNGSAGEIMTIYSIVNTLTELPGINKVQFLIDGQIREAYIHSEFSEPFSRNEDIIKK